MNRYCLAATASILIAALPVASYAQQPIQIDLGKLLKSVVDGIRSAPSGNSESGAATQPSGGSGSAGGGPHAGGVQPPPSPEVEGASGGAPSAQLAGRTSGDLARRVKEGTGFEVPAKWVPALEALPVPPAASPADISAPCKTTAPRFASQSDRAEWIKSDMSTWLLFWAVSHDGARAGTARGKGCFDLAYAASRWQVANGRSPKDPLTRADIDRIDQATRVSIRDGYVANIKFLAERSLSKGATLEQIEEHRLLRMTESFKAGKEAEKVADLPGAYSSSVLPVPAGSTPQTTTTLREPGIHEFLPLAPTNLSAQECYRLSMQEIDKVYALKQARRLHPGTDPRVHVPGHWSRLNAEYPEVGEWMERQLPSGCVPRVKIKAWLQAIGDGSADIDAPNSTASSARLLRTARSSLAAAQKQYAEAKAGEQQKLREQVAAQSKSTGETGKVRTLDLEKIAMGTKQSNVEGLIPSALCRVDENRITCEKALDGCASERRELATAERNATTYQKARVLTGELAQYFVNDKNAQDPNYMEKMKQRMPQLRDALVRCEIAYEHSAAKDSRIRFAGAEVAQVELKFHGGSLDIMRFQVRSDADAVIAWLNRKYGAPRTTWEERQHIEEFPVMETETVFPYQDPTVNNAYGEQRTTIQRESTVHTTRHRHDSWISKAVAVEASGDLFVINRITGR